MQVNSDTMSKDTRISSGSTDIVRIFSTKDALFFTVYLSFWSGDKMLARYLDNHTTIPQHKHSVVRTLMDRAKNIPSTEEEALRETKRVTEALTANNYPANFIYDGRQLNRQQEVNDKDQRGMVILPYAKGFSERIPKVVRGFNIKVVHKPIRTISNILKKPKTRSRKRLPEESCTRSNVKIVIVFTSVRHRTH